jgi:hypothetical protein
MPAEDFDLCEAPKFESRRDSKGSHLRPFTSGTVDVENQTCVFLPFRLKGGNDFVDLFTCTRCQTIPILFPVTQ